ncbi:hypothetical protein [Telmatospirillum sp.]|uniref:hypothetical protein n=1 Tax=Telmatospirillum sp. TaxID=2079197 RepID=UPI00284E8D07|nr:hypothetical protein [Telmatospirillum sp.]MDR3435526.1 hypothetical protein [Telmatospirillum sp.]
MSNYQHGIAIKWGDQLYYVPSEVWQKQTLPDDLKADVAQLINNGAILASVSQTGEGIGAACYLIDLSAIRSDE